MAAGEDPFVTIRIAGDPLEAQMLRDVLSQEGIEATIPGAYHGALLGAAGALIRIPVQVRRSQAEEAACIVEAIDEYDAVLPDGEEGPAVPAEEMERRLALADAQDEGQGPYRAGPIVREAPERPRLKRVAVIASVVLTFGAGHFYARDTRGGLLLLLSELVVLLLAMGGHAPQAMGALPILVIADVVGAMGAVDRANGEQTEGGKASRHAALVGAILALAVALLALLGG